MPVVVIAALIVFISALTASPDVTSPCAIKSDTLVHAARPSLSPAPAPENPERMPQADRYPQAEPSDAAPFPRCDDPVQVAGPPATESRADAPAMPSGVMLVAIALGVTFGTIEVLFRCTIYERPTDHRQAGKKAVRRTRA
jgi:hypothetical protein